MTQEQSSSQNDNDDELFNKIVDLLNECRAKERKRKRVVLSKALAEKIGEAAKIEEAKKDDDGVL